MERGREFDPFDPAQKRILANNRSRGEAKILDSCSSSQIHLWSKSKISNLKSTDTPRSFIDGDSWFIYALFFSPNH